MPNSKNQPPFKTGISGETMFPKTADMPDRDGAPRCEVHYEDEGPLVRVLILDTEGQAHECLLPRVYASPLALLNKQLAFLEALRLPSGLAAPGARRLTHRDTLLYTYLWRLRIKFLIAVHDANYEARFDEGWRWDLMRGYLCREYAEFEHDAAGRKAYWEDELSHDRKPYKDSAVDSMDWAAFLEKDRAKRGWRAFLWRHVGQGYDCTKQADAQRWLAWRSGALSTAPDAARGYEHFLPVKREPAPAPAPAPTPRSRSDSLRPRIREIVGRFRVAARGRQPAEMGESEAPGSSRALTVRPHTPLGGAANSVVTDPSTEAEKGRQAGAADGDENLLVVVHCAGASNQGQTSASASRKRRRTEEAGAVSRPRKWQRMTYHVLVPADMDCKLKRMDAVFELRKKGYQNRST